MPPRRRCPTCGSKQWHKEPSSGLIACSEGHVLQNYRNEATEMDEMGPHAMRKRTLKSGRKKEGTSRANPRLYHGARARFHYFECLQLILRKQIVALTRLWSLPPEFEIVCRDVWALHLDLLPNPPPAEPYHFVTEKGDKKDGGEDGSESPGEDNLKKEDARSSSVRKSHTSSSPMPPDEHKKETQDVSTDEGRDSNDEDEDEEIAALLQQNSDASSSSTSSDEEGETEGGENSRLKKSKKDKGLKGKRKKKGHYAYESPASTLSVLIVAFWTLRIPVLIRDLIRLIESYDLPYLDPIVRRILPESMIIHLTKHSIQALSPYRSPDTMSLYALASRLSKLMYFNYKIMTPEANAAPILWRITEQALGGTPVLYGLIKRLVQTLSLPLTLHHMLSPGLERLKPQDPLSHNYDNIPPEVAFVATGIVILKMVYGLDGQKRVPRNADDPASVLPGINEYLQGLKDLDAADAVRKDAVFDCRKPMRVADLNDEMTDAYLDFCERALLPGDETEDTVLANYFPLKSTGRDNADEIELRVERKRGELETVSRTETGKGGEELRPGERYRIYNSRDVTGTVAVEYETVLRRGAGWTGVDEEYLGGVIEKYERQLMRWWENENQAQQRLARDSDRDDR